MTQIFYKIFANLSHRKNLVYVPISIVYNLFIYLFIYLVLCSCIVASRHGYSTVQSSMEQSPCPHDGCHRSAIAKRNTCGRHVSL